MKWYIDDEGNLGRQNIGTEFEVPDNATGIVVPEGVTCIRAYAFDECEGIASVILPSSLVSIGEEAFNNCVGLTSIALPENLTRIGRKSFAGCVKLTSIALPKGVTRLEEYVFSGCVALKSVALPENLTRIDSGAFEGCASLTSIALPEGLTQIGSGAFCDCASLASLTLPVSMDTIQSWAFRRCASLTEINIPENVRQIGSNWQDAFEDCSGLVNIHVHPNNLYYVDVDGVLYDKSLTEMIRCPLAKESITLLDSMTSVDEAAFKGCKRLKDMTTHRAYDAKYFKSLRFSTDTIAHLMLRQSGKKWQDLLEKSVKKQSKNLDALVLSLVKEMESIQTLSADQTSMIVGFVLSHWEKVRAESLVELYQCLLTRNKDAADKLVNDGIVSRV